MKKYNSKRKCKINFFFMRKNQHEGKAFSSVEKGIWEFNTSSSYLTCVYLKIFCFFFFFLKHGKRI